MDFKVFYFDDKINVADFDYEYNGSCPGYQNFKGQKLDLEYGGWKHLYNALEAKGYNDDKDLWYASCPTRPSVPGQNVLQIRNLIKRGKEGNKSYKAFRERYGM